MNTATDDIPTILGPSILKPNLLPFDSGPSVLELGFTSPSLRGATTWNTQTVAASEEEEGGQKGEKTARKLLPRDVSDKLEPFEALPITLSKFGEHLVSFYLLQYPRDTYLFNQNLNPHPVYTNFAIAMNAPSCFQVILARSALYRIAGQKYGSDSEKSDLELAVLRHKTNAIQHIRKLSGSKSSNKDELIASIISMGTLDRRMGSTVSADMHYSAVRRVLRSIGGPMALRDLRLKRVSCFFECIYGTMQNSYIWEDSDFGGILKRFNAYLTTISEIWATRAISKEAFQHAKQPQSGVGFEASSLGRKAVDRTKAISCFKTELPPPRGIRKRFQPAKRRRAESEPQFTMTSGGQPSLQPSSKRLLAPNPQSSTRPIMQEHNSDTKIKSLTTLTSGLSEKAMVRKRPTYWTMATDSIIRKRLSNPIGQGKETDTSRLIWDLTCLFCLSAIVIDYSNRTYQDLSAYMTKLSKIVLSANLHESENNSNMMWLIMASDSTDEHSKRMWEIAAFCWVCKHLNANLQLELRNWLFEFLMGEEMQKKIKLSTFDFSYASELP